MLLNARGRHRLGHAVRSGSSDPRSTAAQRPRASSSRSRPVQDHLRRLQALLNARGRHRLGHVSPFLISVILLCCSTPEGVIVSVTALSIVQGPVRLVCCSTPEGVIVSVTDATHRAVLALNACSTPEGVIVSVTRSSSRGRPGNTRTAQRPRASSSRSLGEVGAHASLQSSAQRPRASSSRSRRFLHGLQPHSRTAQRPRASSSRSQPSSHARIESSRCCSTPEGVIVSVTTSTRP